MNEFASPDLVFNSFSQLTIFNTICSHLTLKSVGFLIQTNKLIFSKFHKQHLKKYFNLDTANSKPNFPTIKHPKFNFSDYYVKIKPFSEITEFQLPAKTFHSIELTLMIVHSMDEDILESNFEDQNDDQYDLFKYIHEVTLKFQSVYPIHLDKFALSKMILESRKDRITFLLHFGHDEDDPLIFFQSDSSTPLSLTVSSDYNYECNLPCDIHLRAQVCGKNDKFFSEKDVSESKLGDVLYSKDFLFPQKQTLRALCRDKNLKYQYHTVFASTYCPGIPFINRLSIVTNVDIDDIYGIGISFNCADLSDTISNFVAFVFDGHDHYSVPDSISKKIDPGMEYLKQQNYKLSICNFGDKICFDIDFPDLWMFKKLRKRRESATLWCKIVTKRNVWGLDLDIFVETRTEIKYIVAHDNTINTVILKRIPK